MKRFIEGEDRTQVTLLPACLEDYVEAENPVRVVEVFVAGLDLGELGFEGIDPAATGRPAYHPAVLLKLYIYGYLNRVQSSRRLEREAQRNVELMWLTGRLMPDFKTIANFRKDNGRAIRNVCRQFIVLCRQLNLFTAAIVAIDGSKFKAVNNRDKNFTPAKMQRRMAQIEENIARYLADMDTADRDEPEVAELKKLPVVRGAPPIGGDVAQGQPDQFAGGVVGREMATRLDDLAQPRVHALDGVGGVNHPPHGRRKRKERNHVRPSPAPGGGHGWEFLTPWPDLECRQLGLGALGTGGRVNRPDRRRQRLALLPAGASRCRWVTPIKGEAILPLVAGNYRDRPKAEVGASRKAARIACSIDSKPVKLS